LPDWQHKLARGSDTLNGDQSRLPMHFIVSDTAAPEIDRSGRICVPRRLRAMAGIKNEIIVIAMYDWLEIWSRKQ
jgi:MraZ protein